MGFVLTAKATIIFTIICTNICCNSKTERNKTGDSIFINKPNNYQDTIKLSTQKINISEKKQKEFLEGVNVEKVIIYSFLDVHDFEDDTLSKGPLIQIMPNWFEYAWKYDSNPFVILNKKDTKALLSIINQPKKYVSGKSFCFYPRNIFVFTMIKKKSWGIMKYALNVSKLR